MKYDDIWKMDVIEAIQDFLCSDFSTASFQDVISFFDFGEYNTFSAPMSGSRLVLAHSQSDYVFSSNDLDWIDCATSVVAGTLDEAINLFLVEVSCIQTDYYINCAAIIKVLNIAFPGKNIFVFRISNSMAIGCMRDFKESIAGNFCVTDLLSSSDLDKLDELVEILSSTEINDLPQMIIEHSPQEVDLFSNQFDKPKYKCDYSDVLLSYKQPFDTVVTCCSDEPEETCEMYKGKSSDTYRIAAEELKNIASDAKLSSYDLLENAIAAEEKQRQLRQTDISLSNNQNNPTDHVSLSYSSAAYSNAEIMLEEMNRSENK